MIKAPLWLSGRSKHRAPFPLPGKPVVPTPCPPDETDPSCDQVLPFLWNCPRDGFGPVLLSMWRGGQGACMFVHSEGLLTLRERRFSLFWRDPAHWQRRAAREEPQGHVSSWMPKLHFHCLDSKETFVRVPPAGLLGGVCRHSCGVQPAPAANGRPHPQAPCVPAVSESFSLPPRDVPGQKKPKQLKRKN